MPKSKFSKKDLKQVKEGFKQEKITHVDEENIKSLSASEQMHIARSAGRDLHAQNDETNPDHLKKVNEETLKDIRKDFTKSNKITVSYGFEPGNLVHFKHRNKSEIGIVFKINQSSNNNSTSTSDAMSQDEVELLSSAGYIKVQAKSIYEIIECN